MIRDKLINLISNEFSIDKTVICEESNLNKLFLLSDYLEELGQYDENRKLTVKKEGLINNTFPETEDKDDKVLIDITPFFQNTNNKSIIHKDWRGHDSFFKFQLGRILLVLLIEKKFNIQISDDDADNFETVGQIISCIENTK
jgi:acyl carrier protein